MTFAWLKRSMPRSLYGRAALILILPIVVLQLVVSVVFIQRHFEGVTRQMADSLVLELGLVLAPFREAPDAATALAAARDLAAPLQIGVEPAADLATGADPRRFYDLSGRVVIAELRAGLPGIARVDLSDPRVVGVLLETPQGPVEVSFARRRVSASNPHQLLVLMIATGVLMTLIAVLFLRNQLRPIRRLARAAEAFGKGRSIRYAPSGALEVRSAGNAFLSMRARIERQIEQRTLMLSGVSHDLRTPLTRMKLALEIMPQDPETEALKRDVADMQSMLDEFLAFAQGDSGDALDEVDPVALAEGAVADAERAGQSVSLRLEPGTEAGTLVALRPMAVRRALANLIGNAGRHGTRCRLSLALTPAALRFTVEDDGPGIPPGQREAALRPFARLEASRNLDRGGGVGLGLAIATDIARSHGGTLKLGESADLGGLRADLVLAR